MKLNGSSNSQVEMLMDKSDVVTVMILIVSGLTLILVYSILIHLPVLRHLLG